MRSTPDTLYSTVNGTDYQDRWFASLIPGYAAINMPDGVSSTELSDYVKTHGYPVTDLGLTVTSVQLAALSEGFLKANELEKMIGSSAVNRGEFARILERQLKAGKRFKIMT